MNCSDLDALKVLTVAVMELMKEENVPIARRITQTAKNLVQVAREEFQKLCLFFVTNCGSRISCYTLHAPSLQICR